MKSFTITVLTILTIFSLGCGASSPKEGSLTCVDIEQPDGTVETFCCDSDSCGSL